MRKDRPDQPREDEVSRLRRQARLLEAIGEVQAEFIAAEGGAHAAFNRLLDVLLDVTGSEYGFIGEVLHASDAPYLHCRAISNIAWDEASRAAYARSETDGMVFTRLDSLFGHTVRTGERVIANDPSNDPRAGGLPPGHRAMASYLGVPLVWRGGMIGMAGIANRPGGYDAGLADELQPLLTTMAALIAAGRAETRRQAAESALSQTAQRLELAVSGSLIAIWDWDLRDDSLYWSPRFCEIVGVADDDFTGHFSDFTARIHPDDRDRVTRALDAHFERRAPYDIEMRLRRDDGGWVDIRARGVAARDAAGAAIRMVGSVVDITAERAAERAAKQANARIELAVEAAGLGLMDVDFETGSARVNHRLTDMVGDPRIGDDPAPLSALLDIIHPDDVAAVTARIAAIRSGAATRLRSEHRIVRPDGRVVWTETHAAPTRVAADGSVAAVTGVVLDLTERKEAELELAEAKQRYELAIKGSLIAIWDRDLVTDELYLSERMGEILGARPAAFHGPYDLFRARIHPEDIAHVRGAYQAHLTDNAPYDVEMRVRHDDGHYVHVRARGRAIRDAAGAPARMSGSVTDITAERAAESEARSAGVRAQLALKAAQLAVWEMDVRAGEVHMDRTLAELTGAPWIAEGPITPKQAYRFTHPDDLERVRGALAGLQAGEVDQVAIEHRIVHADGHPIWIVAHVAVAERSMEGAPLRLIGVTQDLTELKATERALRDAVDEAEAASAAKSQFLANMSHEIRTPLNGVLGIAQLLELTELDPRQQGYVATIRNSGRALQAVIEDVLDISRIEAGKLKLVRRPVVVETLVGDCVDTVAGLAEQKGLALNAMIDPALGAEVLIDGARLRQVLTNLLSNAVKFTERGSVTVRGAFSAPDRLRFEVEDTGPGLAPGAEDVIFDRFSQADMSHSRTHEGSGLGLAIARELVQLAGGDIGVRSRPGEGCLFWFEQPAPAVGARRRPAETAGSAGSAVAAARPGRRVLIVEDHPVNRNVTAEMLAHAGFEPVLAESGADALERLKEQPCDAVLMDLHMPGMGGDEALRRIRAGEAGAPSIPVFMVTADVTTEARARSDAHGADRFFSKPVNMDVLIDAIQSCLEDDAREGAA